MVFQHSGGRDFDLLLPRHIPDTPATQGLPLWCFNIVGGEILTFPDTPTTQGLPLLWCFNIVASTQDLSVTQASKLISRNNTSIYTSAKEYCLLACLPPHPFFSHFARNNG